MKPIIKIANLVIETDSLLTASMLIKRIIKKDAVRGTIQYHGKKIRWSTLQQYDYHNGFTAKKS